MAIRDFFNRQGAIIRLLAAAAVVQLAFWFVFVPVFVLPPVERPDFIAITGFATAEPETASTDGAEYVDTAPSRELREPGYYAVRVTFDLDEVPDAGLALLDNSGGDNGRIRVNGVLIHTPGRMDLEAPTYHALYEGIVHIPAGVLRPGENEVESVYVVSLARGVSLLPPLLGEYSAVSEAFGWKAFTLTQWRRITTTMVFVVAIFAGLAAWRSRDRDIPFWLFMVAAGWTLYSLFFVLPNLPLHGAMRGFAYAASTMFLALSWAIFTDAWSGRRLRYFRPAVWLAFAVGIVWSGWALFVQRDAGAFGRVETAVEWVGLLLAAATVLRLGWHFVRRPGETRVVEAAALILLASLMLFYLGALVIEQANRPYLLATQPLILLVLVAGFLVRNFELFRSREQLNAELETNLAVRTRELRNAHEREKGLLRERAHHEERRRIMRDMHDGMGSTLMGMLLAARRGRADPDSVALGLQTVIDEMRLLIDSMDSVGESLESALVLFRDRTQSRVIDAGFTFEWIDETDGRFPALPPRAGLQVFRILQEMITNALKHSDGDRITVRIAPDTISVTDNGSRFEGPRRSGRGLDNMEARAGAIGGAFDIAHGEEGTIARLRLPSPENGA